MHPHGQFPSESAQGPAEKGALPNCWIVLLAKDSDENRRGRLWRARRRKQKHHLLNRVILLELAAAHLQASTGTSACPFSKQKTLRSLSMKYNLPFSPFSLYCPNPHLQSEPLPSWPNRGFFHPTTHSLNSLFWHQSGRTLLFLFFTYPPNFCCCLPSCARLKFPFHNGVQRRWVFSKFVQKWLFILKRFTCLTSSLAAKVTTTALYQHFCVLPIKDRTNLFCEMIISWIMKGTFTAQNKAAASHALA